MADTPEWLADKLQSEGEKVVEFFSSLTPEQWECTIYSEGSAWKVRQVLAHFITSEKGFIGILNDVLMGGQGAPENFDINQYNETTVAAYQANSPESLVKEYQRLRGQTVQRVKAMRARDLERQGRHPYLGVAPLTDIIKLMYRHQQIHIRDVRKVLQGEGNEATAKNIGDVKE